MVDFERNQKLELDAVLRKAEDFHGHLGPFLVIGVRMGLVGVRELGVNKNDGLQVTAMTQPFIPFSCVIDGIQVATHCTIGNKKLRLKDSSRISASFKFLDEKQVIVTVNPTMLERLKGKLLSKDISSEEAQKLAENVASMPEEELFIIEGSR